EIANIDGFAELTAEQIFKGLESIRDEYQILIKAGFELEKTHLSDEVALIESPFHNKKIVFTGAMSHSRSELEKQAKMLGISVAKSVSSKTDFLIIGENVGQSKMNKAKNHGVQILSESEYLKKLNI
ncbi:MAG: DNA ligase, partial [Candidatus Thioglobus sp.]|nr:DNA ligase [Candidatus Thioglobus sp.]